MENYVVYGSNRFQRFVIEGADLRMDAKLFKKLGRHLSVLICVTFVLGWAAPFFTMEAEAATSRVAKVISVSGDVQVTKAGGKKPYKAFKNLYLNQGDHLKTGSDANVVLEVEDRKDEVTVGPNSSLYVSKLQEDEGKNTSFKVWSGSMWVKASTLLETDDSFEVETPTAVMGVRGTNFGVDVNAVKSAVLVGSGIVQVETKTLAETTSSEPDRYYVFPTQQLNVLTDPVTQNIETYQTVTNIEQVVQQADPAILKAVLANAEVIAEENRGIIDRFQSGTLSVPVPTDLEDRQAAENFAANALVFPTVVAVQSVTKQKLTEQEIPKTATINLSGPSSMTLTPSQQQVLQQAVQTESTFQQKQTEQIQLQQQSRQELAGKVNQQTSKQQQQNQHQLATRNQQVEQQYINVLTEQRKQQYQQNKQINQSQVTPTSPSSPTSSSGGSGTSGEFAGSALNASGTLNGNVTITVNETNPTLYGPATGLMTVNGNVVISGLATKYVDLRNVKITGSLTVKAANASVYLDETVQVVGQTLLEDVAIGTFDSMAHHTGSIKLIDTNGSRLYLGGAASNARVELNGSGMTILEGHYHQEVVVKGANTQLEVWSGAIVSGLDIQAAGVTLGKEDGAFIDSLRSSNSVALDPSVASVKHEIDTVLTTINSTDSYLLDTVLMSNGYAVSYYQTKVVEGHRPFASLVDVRNLLNETPVEGVLQIDAVTADSLNGFTVNWQGNVYADRYRFKVKDVATGRTYSLPEYDPIEPSADPFTSALTFKEWYLETGKTYELTVIGADGPDASYDLAKGVYRFVVPDFPLSIVFTSPIQGGSYFPYEQPLRIKFNDPVSFTDELDLDHGMVLSKDGVAVPVTAALSSDKKSIYVFPDTRLVSYGAYLLTIPAGMVKSDVVSDETNQSATITFNSGYVEYDGFTINSDSRLNSIDLNWQAVPDADGYAIKELVSGVYTTIGTTTEPAYTITGLTPDTMYQFRVDALVAGKTINARELSTGTLPELSVTAAVYGQYALVKWNSVTVGTTYADIYVEDTFVGTKTGISANLFTSNVVDANSDSLIEVRMNLRNSANVSLAADSTTVNLSTQGTITGMTMTVTDDLYPNWDDVTGATKYHLILVTESGASYLGTTTVSNSDLGVPPATISGQTITFIVFAEVNHVLVAAGAVSKVVE